VGQTEVTYQLLV